MRPRLIAAALQTLGILVTAAGVGFVSFAAGLMVLGIGVLALGVALERGSTHAG